MKELLTKVKDLKVSESKVEHLGELGMSGRNRLKEIESER